MCFGVTNENTADFLTGHRPGHEPDSTYHWSILTAVLRLNVLLVLVVTVVRVSNCAFNFLNRLYFIYGLYVYTISMLDYVTLNFSVINEL